jgi:hypothetical protein
VRRTEPGVGSTKGAFEYMHLSNMHSDAAFASPMPLLGSNTSRVWCMLFVCSLLTVDGCPLSVELCLPDVSNVFVVS